MENLEQTLKEVKAHAWDLREEADRFFAEAQKRAELVQIQRGEIHKIVLEIEKQKNPVE